MRSGEGLTAMTPDMLRRIFAEGEPDFSADICTKADLGCLNVCYGNEELWVLNMAKKGVFGTLTYAEAAYNHNLRQGWLFTNAYWNMWRIRHHIKRDGNLYTTHG